MINFPPDAPFRAGETIGGQGDALVIEPVYNDEDDPQEDLSLNHGNLLPNPKYWTATCNKLEEYYSHTQKPLKFADAEEDFVSRIHAFSDSETGKGYAVIFGLETLYIFQIKDDKLVVEKRGVPYSRRTANSNMITFWGTFSRHNTPDSESKKERVLYSFQVGNDPNVYVRDLNDDSYKKEFKLKEHCELRECESVVVDNKRLFVFTISYMKDVEKPENCPMKMMACDYNDIIDFDASKFYDVNIEDVFFKESLYNYRSRIDVFGEGKFLTGKFLKDGDLNDQIVLQTVRYKNGRPDFYASVYRTSLDKNLKLVIKPYHHWTMYCWDDIESPRETYPCMDTQTLFKIMNVDGSYSIVVKNAGFKIGYNRSKPKFSVHDFDKQRYNVRLQIIYWDDKKKELLPTSCFNLYQTLIGDNNSRHYSILVPWSKVWPIYKWSKEKLIVDGFMFMGVGTHVNKYGETNPETGYNLYKSLFKTKISKDRVCFEREDNYGSMIHYKRALTNRALYKQNAAKFRHYKELSLNFYHTQKFPKDPDIGGISLNHLGFCFFGTTDLYSRQMRLGKPYLTLNENKKQLFARYKAVPYEKDFSQVAPTLNFSTMNNEMKGTTTTTTNSKSVGGGTSTSVNIPYFHASIFTQQNNSWHSSSTTGDHHTTMLHMMSGFQDEDGIHSLSMSCAYWEYPFYMYEKAGGEVAGYISYVVHDPKFEPIDSILSPSDQQLIYFPDHENGHLLTYMNHEKQDYDSKNLYFNLTEMTVTADNAGGSILTYSKMDSTQEDKSKGANFSSNVTASVNGGGGKNKGKYGVNIGVNGHWSKSSSDNSNQTHTTTDDLTIMFHAGSVNDVGYEYTIIPYVYNACNNGPILIEYDVNLTGYKWKSKFKIVDLRCMRVYPNSNDAVQSKFSRDIRFEEKEDGYSIDLSVKLFNASFSDCERAKIEIFKGSPTVIKGKIDLDSNPDVCQKVDVINIKDGLKSMQRGTFTTNLAKPEHGTKYWVRVSNLMGLEPIGEQKIYWGIYPYEAIYLTG